MISTFRDCGTRVRKLKDTSTVWKSKKSLVTSVTLVSTKAMLARTFSSIITVAKLKKSILMTIALYKRHNILDSKGKILFFENLKKTRLKD